MELRQTAECERILQVARYPRLPKPAACEQLAQAGGGGLQAIVRALPEHRVQDGRVGEERLHLERSRRVQCIAKARAVGHREGGYRGRERVVVDHRHALAGLEPEPDPLDQRRGHIAHRRQIGLAQRAQHSYRDRPPLVERLYNQIGQLGPDPCCGPGEIVRQPQEGASHDLIARRRALADPAVHDKQPVELVNILRVDGDPLERAGTGRKPVDRRTLRTHLLEHLPGTTHPLDRLRSQRHPGPLTGDGDDLVEPKTDPIEDDGHRPPSVTAGYTRPRLMTVVTALRPIL